MTDEGPAISYKLLRRGTPVQASDGTRLGTTDRVLENEREHIFDGLVVSTREGTRFVDAPEVARIAELRVTLGIDAAAAAQLPERDPKGATEFQANVGKRFGRMWRRRRR